MFVFVCACVLVGPNSDPRAASFGLKFQQMFPALIGAVGSVVSADAIGSVAPDVLHTYHTGTAQEKEFVAELNTCLCSFVKNHLDLLERGTLFCFSFRILFSCYHVIGGPCTCVCESTAGEAPCKAALVKAISYVFRITLVDESRFVGDAITKAAAVSITTAGVEDHTTRLVVDLVKSHLSGAIILSEDERKAEHNP